MNLSAARAAATHLHAQMPDLPDETIHELILRPRAAAPDEATFAFITRLPSGIVHSLWTAERKARAA